MIGLILAGGRATRLGPLAAQLNKSLVTVGQRPQLVRQVLQLRNANCSRVVVVVSPSQREQVQSVIDHAGLPDVYVSVQETPNGPADAIIAGLIAPVREDVTLLLADTLVPDDAVRLPGNSVLTAPAPSTRGWCIPEGHGVFSDGVATKGQHVCVGAYRFDDARKLLNVAHDVTANANGEVGMGPLLTRYGGLRTATSGGNWWLDVGDVAALSHARRSNFMSRSFSELTVTDEGLVHKSGGTHGEAAMMNLLSSHLPGLVPHVVDSDESRDSYTMEYIDLPSLAELWLYWPGGPALWEHIGERLFSGLEQVWEISAQSSHVEPLGRRLLERYDKYQSPYLVPGDSFKVNGLSVPTDIVERTAAAVDELDLASSTIHGDPNFTNVLWSLGSSTFKLLDPRGDQLGFTMYDVAKVLYSPVFAPIAHGLFDVKSVNAAHRPLSSVTVDLWSQRAEAHPALWAAASAVHGFDPEAVRLLIAYVLLSGAPLHSRTESLALFAVGADTAVRCGV